LTKRRSDQRDQSNVAQNYGLSETAYSFGYDLRLKYSSFMSDTLSWLSNNCFRLLPADSPDILSLGCGTGIFDNEFIKIIQEHKRDWLFTGLDFSATDLARFRKKTSILDQETRKKITLEYKKFTPSTQMDKQYDLITMVHFLHSFDDVMPIIKNALRHLLPGGKLLIIQQKKQGIAELKHSLRDLLPNQKFHCSDQIKDLLEMEKIVFSSETVNTFFDISMMKKRSLDTLLLMSFCLCNDLSVLTTQQQEKIRKAFLSISQEGKQRQEGENSNEGTHYINEIMDIIICKV
jgi:ubiquinone/menaquinone biosynthesis C-methylase UbiE